jgi:hypothetical protein
MPAVLYNITEVYQYADFEIEIGYPSKDLTAYTFKCQVRLRAAADSPIICEPTVTLVDGPSGKIKIAMTASETGALPITGNLYSDVTTYIYDIVGTDGTSTLRIAQGSFKVSPAVTR